jgi:uncharacterized membrane protein
MPHSEIRKRLINKWSCQNWKLSTLSLIIFFSFPSLHTKAQFYVKNLTNEEISICIGYYESNKWMAEGWWNIPPREDFMLKKSIENKYFYIHAKSKSEKLTYTGETEFCIDKSNPFTLLDRDNCPVKGKFRMVSTDGKSAFRVALEEWPLFVWSSPVQAEITENPTYRRIDRIIVSDWSLKSIIKE